MPYSPYFYRHSYIVFARGSNQDRPVESFTVHGVFFAFSKSEAARMDVVTERVEELAKEIAEENGMFGLKTEGDIEVEQVSHGEAVGIGFYRAHIFVDDVFHEKIDLRSR